MNVELLEPVKQRAPLKDALYSKAFTHHPYAQLLIDPYSDKVLAANQRACRLLDYALVDLERTPVSHIYRVYLPGLITFTQSVIEAGHAQTYELPCYSASGEEIAVEHCASAYTLDDRLVILLTIRPQAEIKWEHDKNQANQYVRKGLTEWQHVEQLFHEIERENNLILSAAGEGIYGVNRNGITTFVNPAAERILGWTADDLVGQSMHKLIHHTHADGTHYHELDCPIYAAFRDGTVHHVEDEVFWAKDGSPLSVEYTSTPIYDHGQLVGAVVVFRDVTDRKLAEEKLRSALDEVEQLKKKLELENAYLQEEIREEYKYREIVGRSQAVHKTIQQIELVAPTNATALITGESGTGKELIARAIHEISDRSERPLIRVNCAAIPRELFESEFFGHVRGAFTGAVKERTGRFELADGGTLFLDEVGEIPLELQGKLLRVLQEGQFERVGEARTRNVDVRVIAATNRDLSREVEAGRFRSDLYFRLNVFPIESVPLRKRVEDIPLLATHFLNNASKHFGVKLQSLSQADMQRLVQYNWPGNVRELENVIERAVILSRDGKLRIDLPDTSTMFGDAPDEPRVQAAKPAKDDNAILTESERQQRDRETIIHALKMAKGKVFGDGGAAEILGVKPTTLTSRLKRLGIDKSQYKN